MTKKMKQPRANKPSVTRKECKKPQLNEEKPFDMAVQLCPLYIKERNANKIYVLTDFSKSIV